MTTPEVGSYRDSLTIRLNEPVLPFARPNLRKSIDSESLVVLREVRRRWEVGLLLDTTIYLGTHLPIRVEAFERHFRSPSITPLAPEESYLFTKKDYDPITADQLVHEIRDINPKAPCELVVYVRPPSSEEETIKFLEGLQLRVEVAGKSYCSRIDNSRLLKNAFFLFYPTDLGPRTGDLIGLTMFLPSSGEQLSKIQIFLKIF